MDLKPTELSCLGIDMQKRIEDIIQELMLLKSKVELLEKKSRDNFSIGEIETILCDLKFRAVIDGVTFQAILAAFVKKSAQ